MPNIHPFFFSSLTSCRPNQGAAPACSVIHTLINSQNPTLVFPKIILTHGIVSHADSFQAELPPMAIQVLSDTLNTDLPTIDVPLIIHR